jgi:hypothetical protein
VGWVVVPVWAGRQAKAEGVGGAGWAGKEKKKKSIKN